MSRSRQNRYAVTLPALAFIIIILSAGHSYGQSNPQPFSFRSGQSMYIVAFCVIHSPIVLNEVPVGQQGEYINTDLDAERKVRKRIEEWHYLKLQKN